MYETLLTKINTTLESVSNIKEIFSVPNPKLSKFPAVFFKPDGFENAFETNDENMKTYRFILIVIIGVKQTTLDNIFGTVLPKTVDAIVEQFDADWNYGTIDGHRMWAKIDSAGPWEVSEEQDGLVAYAPLNLEIKLLSTN